jgi:thiamine pyrophosphate-dependent acetolactate synthase large subunit-like protein
MLHCVTVHNNIMLLYTVFCAQGCLSDDHPLCLGPIGVHGLFTANTAVAQCDMVMALGCRFDERAACKSFELWQVCNTKLVGLPSRSTTSCGTCTR